MSRKALLVLGLLLILILAVVVIVLVLKLTESKSPSTTVHTTCGPVQGSYNDEYNTFSFKGLPFAAPPVGEKRWKKPEPLKRKQDGSCWDGVYEAREFPPQCAQLDMYDGVPTGQEDCLYLNVFTLSLDNRPLPVMVYIHGGFLQYLNASLPGYSPDAKVARRTNMVQVSIQYRLALFGFLALDQLPGKGNYGIWDMVQALKWVQQNIANFGGDPNQVTLYGQSAGGTAIFALMASPFSRGLFHRAWLISGSPTIIDTLDDFKKKNGQAFIGPNTTISKMCPHVTETCLYSMNWKDIASLVYPFWDGFDLFDLPTKGVLVPSMIVIDGELIPKDPFRAWENKSGNYHDVPALITSTAQEVDLFPAPWQELNSWDQAKLWKYIASKLDTFGGNLTEKALNVYPWEHTAAYVFTTMATDIRVTCRTDEQAKKATKGQNSPVYRAVITSWPSHPINSVGFPWHARYSFHLWDTSAFFLYLDNIIPNPSNADKAFQDLLYREVMSFIKNGKPADRRWKPYPGNTALISDKLKVVDQYQKEQCALWVENGLMEYAWVN